jgi:hypothetical protein
MSNALSSMVSGIFSLAWRRYGKPLMAVVPPIAQWTLPAGFSYDPETDQVMSAGGVVLDNWGDYYAAEYLYIVPIAPSADRMTLAAAGVVPAGSTDVYVLKADADTARNAHSVQIDGEWYDVVEVARAPLGAGSPGTWARVTLQRRS